MIINICFGGGGGWRILKTQFPSFLTPLLKGHGGKANALIGRSFFESDPSEIDSHISPVCGVVASDKRVFVYVYIVICLLIHFLRKTTKSNRSCRI